MNVHYNTTTGQIMSYGYGADHGDGFEESHFPGCKVTIIPDQPIDARRQRFDPDAWKVVDKDVPDPPPDRMWEVRAVVIAELAASDKFAVSDFPVSEADRAAWMVYRKALRDASKGRAAWGDVLAAIPNRPDGSDPVAQLRVKLIADCADHKEATA